MSQRRKPFPISLLLIAVLLLLIYFMNDGKFGVGSGSQSGKSDIQEDTSTVNIQPAMTTDRVIEDTVHEAVDTTVIEEKQELEEQSEVLAYNSVSVTKKNDTLYYNINEKAYTNLLAGIAETNFELPYRVKLAGNLTYAEEREIKDILEEKEIDFTIVENL